MEAQKSDEVETYTFRVWRKRTASQAWKYYAMSMSPNLSYAKSISPKSSTVKKLFGSPLTLSNTYMFFFIEGTIDPKWGLKMLRKSEARIDPKNWDELVAFNRKYSACIGRILRGPDEGKMCGAEGTMESKDRFRVCGSHLHRMVRMSWIGKLEGA